MNTRYSANLLRPLRVMAALALGLAMLWGMASCRKGRTSAPDAAHVDRTQAQQPEITPLATGPGGVFDCALVEEAGFPCDRQAGRSDPFEAVPYIEKSTALPQRARENPEMYRVLGTAKTNDGIRLALIQMGAEPFVIKEGERVTDWVVSAIHDYTVELKLEDPEMQFSLRMGNRERIPLSAQGGLLGPGAVTPASDRLSNQNPQGTEYPERDAKVVE